MRNIYIIEEFSVENIKQKECLVHHKLNKSYPKIF